MEITLEFEHAGHLYCVRRGYKVGSGGRGTATLDLEEQHETLTRASTAETQAELERLLGLTRATFRASSFLKQGDSAAFPEATAADRKALLGAMLDPRGLWPSLAGKAADARKATEADLAATQVKITERQEIADRLPELEAALNSHATLRHEAGTEASLAEQALEAALAAVQQNAGAAERLRVAQEREANAVASRERALQALGEAREFERLVPVTRERLTRLTEVADRVPGLELRAEEMQAAKLAQQEETLKLAALEAKVTDQRDLTKRLDADLADTHLHLNALVARLVALEDAPDGTERCDHCEQLLGHEAKQTALTKLRQEKRELARLGIEQTESAKSAMELFGELHKALAEAQPVPRISVEGDFETPLREARAAAVEAATAQAELASHEAEAARAPALTEAVRDAAEEVRVRAAESAAAAEGIGDTPALQLAAGNARSALLTRRSALDAANAVLTRLEEQIGRAQTAQAELDALREDTRLQQGLLDLYKLAERAFGRDGIPVLLVEAVIPQLEAEANRILELMPTADGAVLTLALRTQRAQKTTEHLRETLDIVVSDADGERTYETFSGGERARLNLALRIAFARLLAHRRGAESRLLAIDELEYLDAAGQESLVDVVKSVASDFSRVLVVSHSPQVRDAFDAVLEIEKTDGLSRVAGALGMGPA